MARLYDNDTPEPALTGPQKAAVVLLALGEAHGRAIWESLDEDEIKLISTEMLQLGSIRSGIVEAILDDLTRQASDPTLRGGLEETRALLARILPAEMLDDLLEHSRGQSGRTMYQKLADVSPGLVASYLKNEHPQTVAVVLSRLPVEQTARILRLLPARLGEDVACRILTMGQVPREILDRIDQTLRSEFIASLGRQRRRNPIEQMAEILNNIGKEDEDRFILAIDRLDPDMSEKVRANMFSFERLAEAPSHALQTLLRHVDREDLVLALKGASSTVREVFFANMTRRSGTALRQEMEAIGPVRLKNVDEAQSRMIAIARSLEREGEIHLVPDFELDQLIE